MGGLTITEWFRTLRSELCCRQCEQKALVHARELFEESRTESKAKIAELQKREETLIEIVQGYEQGMIPALESKLKDAEKQSEQLIEELSYANKFKAELESRLEQEKQRTNILLKALQYCAIEPGHLHAENNRQHAAAANALAEYRALNMTTKPDSAGGGK